MEETKEPNENISNFFIDNCDSDSDSNTEINNINDNVLLSSSDTSNEEKPKVDSISIPRVISNGKIVSIMNATNGNDIINNNNNNIIDNLTNKPKKKSKKSSLKEAHDNHISLKTLFQIPNYLKQKKPSQVINGWDFNANNTVLNWYQTFKQQSYTYQWLLDKNKKISDKLNLMSIIFSSLLGIFSAFKLWIKDDEIFQTISNVIIMLSNFCIAIMTSASKKYIDDIKNEKIRMYIEDVDKFLGKISATILKAPIYRMNANEFIENNNDTYTKLITYAPNLSTNELIEGKKQYLIYVDNMNKYIEEYKTERESESDND